MRFAPAKHIISIFVILTLSFSLLNRSSSKVSPKDLVSVLAEWNGTLNCYCVTLNFGYFILFPDTLVSGTTVTGAVFCKRKAVLSDRYPGIDGNNKIVSTF